MREDNGTATRQIVSVSRGRMAQVEIGGGVIYEYHEKSGKWVGKFITGWVI